jgi:hypothetical protein
MIFILYVLLHAVLMSSVITFAYFGARVVLESQDGYERLLRTGMVVCGGLATLAGQVAGLTVAEFTVDALSNASPVALTASAAVPATGGVLLGWYLVRIFPRSHDVAKRITVFIATVAVIEFILLYGQTVRREGLDMGTAVIPNVSFVVGVILYIALTYKKKPDRVAGGGAEAGGGRRFIR